MIKYTRINLMLAAIGLASSMMVNAQASDNPVGHQASDNPVGHEVNCLEIGEHILTITSEASATRCFLFPGGMPDCKQKFGRYARL